MKNDLIFKKEKRFFFPTKKRVLKNGPHTNLCDDCFCLLHEGPTANHEIGSHLCNKCEKEKKEGHLVFA